MILADQPGTLAPPAVPVRADRDMGEFVMVDAAEDGPGTGIGLDQPRQQFSRDIESAGFEVAISTTTNCSPRVSHARAVSRADDESGMAACEASLVLSQAGFQQLCVLLPRHVRWSGNR